MKSNLISSLPPIVYLRLRRLYFKASKPDQFAKIQAQRNLNYSNSSYSLKPLIESKSVFVHIPKCAGISVSQALYGNLGGGHTTLDGYLNLLTPEEAVSFFKFTIVRNPWDRLVSAYHFLKAGGIGKNDQTFFEQELSQYSDFEDFVRNWLSHENILKYHHFKPQTQYIYTPHHRISVDFVGFFENLGEDFQKITSFLNKSCELKKHNSSKRRNSYQDYYTLETKKKVEEIYRDDIFGFGYTFDNLTVMDPK